VGGPNELPLVGRTIAVLRAREPGDSLIPELERLGAEVLVAPLWRIEAPVDPGPLERALARLEAYDWVVFTSVNGVDAFFQTLAKRGVGEGEWRHVRFAAVGPATARALHERGAKARVMAKEHRAEGLVEALAAEGISGARILIPRAQDARDVVVKGLRALGAVVEDVVAYRLAREPVDRETLLRLGSAGTDALLVTSPSTVRYLSMAYAEQGLHWPTETPCFCIGPVTADAARAHGLRVAAVASRYTISGLLEALVQHFSASGPTGV